MSDFVTRRLIASIVVLGLVWAGLGAPTVGGAVGIVYFIGFAIGRILRVAIVFVLAKYLYARLRDWRVPRSERPKS